MPKFHDGVSLALGMLAGLFVAFSSVVAFDYGHWLVGLFQVAVGWVLMMHCLDMMRYWRRHRIVKIVKTDTERLIYKG